MKIRNIEVDFDFLDANDVERFENEAKKLLDRCDEEAQKNYSASESIKVQCKIVEDFFDKVFGEGISERIFKKKNNLKEHLSIYEEVIKERQFENNEMKNKFGRYQPNREQRRYNKHKGNHR
jgi:hypothetical protein